MIRHACHMKNQGNLVSLVAVCPDEFTSEERSKRNKSGREVARWPRNGAMEGGYGMATRARQKTKGTIPIHYVKRRCLSCLTVHQITCACSNWVLFFRTFLFFDNLFVLNCVVYWSHQNVLVCSCCSYHCVATCPSHGFQCRTASQAQSPPIGGNFKAMCISFVSRLSFWLTWLWFFVTCVRCQTWPLIFCIAGGCGLSVFIQAYYATKSPDLRSVTSEYVVSFVWCGIASHSVCLRVVQMAKGQTSGLASWRPFWTIWQKFLDPLH